MPITVCFCGIQRAVTRTNKIQITLLDNSRVMDVLAYVKDLFPDLSLDEEEVLVTINNTASTMNHLLESDDNIAFLPHIGGG